MSENNKPIFVRKLRVTIPFETYEDPAREAEHRTKGAVATSGALLCEHLFWAVQRLAYHGREATLAADPDDFFESLQAIGLVGRAVAAGVCEEASNLQVIAERLLKEQAQGGTR